MHVAHCKHCNKPVEQAIEGELICSKCWNNQQKSAEELHTQSEIEHFLTHCSDCSKTLHTQSEKDSLYCKPCWDRIQKEDMIAQMQATAMPGEIIPSVEELSAPSCPYCGKQSIYEKKVNLYFCCEVVIEA